MKKQIKKAKKYLEWEKPKQAIAELHLLLNSKSNKGEYAWIPNHLMGIALSMKAEHQSSAQYLQKAIKAGSEEPESFHMLSVNYYKLGQFEKAEQFGKEAVNKRDDFLKAWLNLGSVYRSQAKLEKALECYQKANQIDPKNADVAYNIGKIYRDQGDLDQAMKMFDVTLQVDEDHLVAMLERADLLKDNGKLDEALEKLTEAHEKHDNHPAIAVSEAEVSRAQGDYDYAIELYEQILEDYPQNGPLLINYALCLQEVGRFEESEKYYREAISLMEDSRNAISNYLMGLHYNPENSREYIFNEHIKYCKEFVPKDEVKERLEVDVKPDKKLKLGFISSGFRRHPVGWMIAGAIEQLPDDDFELVCYTTDNRFDFITRRIHRNIDQWKSIIGYSDEVIKNIILDDNLDILIDLTGHAADNCMNVMAHKPASVLVKWVGGLFNTTGIEAFDYLISDWHETPKGEEQYYTEKLVRLPDDYISFTPPAYAPDVKDLPAVDNGYITFGCFNNPTKVNEEVLQKWAQIMRQVPESRLYLKSKQYDTASFREQIIEVMEEQSISKDRILFEGHTSHNDHLDAYNKVDIALDPWPYSGGLTTCEALYMGVPVITMPGPTFAGRHSTTHLMNAGLQEFVTGSWEAYTKRAVALANDKERLQQMRDTLRDQILHSPVCDGKRFGAHLSVAFRKMWKQWLEGQKNGEEEWQDHIEVEPLSDEKISELTDGPRITPLFTVKEHKEENNAAPNIESNGKETEEMELTDASEIDIESSVNGQKSDSSKNEQQDDTLYIETKDNVTICTPGDLDLMTSYVLLEQKQWFEPELDFVREYLQPGMQVVDAGASFGAFALSMSRQVGKQGAVYAFEPGSVAKKYLEMSRLENDFDQLEIIGRGLGGETGEAKLKTAETPELNIVDIEGDENISLTTFDAWWDFAGRPKLDFLKIDVNGMEPEVLVGASAILQETDPVVLISIGENEKSLKQLSEQFSDWGYRLYEYIPGPALLAEHEPEAGVDPYLMNMIAIKENRIEEFKESGWIFDEDVSPVTPEDELWKETLGKEPWTASQIDDWKEKTASGQHEEYLQALNMICAAEQIDEGNEDPQARSRKGATMLAAAQKLIGLFNSGNAGISAALTYVRVMSQLGKRGQAVEMMNELMEKINSGGNANASLPFFPPLPEQDARDIQTDFSKWLTVRIVEGWIMLQNPTTYMAGEQTQGMLEALEGNPEVVKRFGKPIELNFSANNADKKQNNKGSKPSGTFVHLCFNHVYAKSLSDLIGYTNKYSDQQHWLFIEKHRAIPSYSADISDKPQSTFFDKRSQLKEVLHECLKSKVDGVFVHGLFFDWQKALISEIASKKHIGWIMWGGDLYNPIKDQRYLNDIISKINSIYSPVEGDIDFFKRTYGERKYHRFGYPYPNLYGNIQSTKTYNLKRIIVGNSGDPSNEHIKILRVLSGKKDIKNYNMYLPLAYNLTTKYRNKLIANIKELGITDQVELQENFIEPNEYFKIITSSKMVVTAHQRKQGMGNILSSIYSGNQTIVRKHIRVNSIKEISPTWKFLKEYNLHPIKFKDLQKIDSVIELNKVGLEDKERHQGIIKKEFGISKRAGQLLKACRNIIKS